MFTVSRLLDDEDDAAAVSHVTLECTPVYSRWVSVAPVTATAGSLSVNGLPSRKPLSPCNPLTVTGILLTAK